MGVSQILRSRHVWNGVALAALFWIGAWLLPRPVLFEIVNSLVLCVSVAVVVAYGRPALSALKANQISSPVQLAMGITVGFASDAVSRVWALAWREMGRPAGMTDHPVLAFIVFTGVVAGVLHLTSPGAIDGHIPRMNLIYLGLAFGAAALIAAVLSVSM